MTSKRSDNDRIIPAYIERNANVEQVYTGGRIIEQGLQNLIRGHIDLINNPLETEKNITRYKYNEPFVFSDDHQRFFNERVKLGPVRLIQPILYKINSVSYTHLTLPTKA